MKYESTPQFEEEMRRIKELDKALGLDSWTMFKETLGIVLLVIIMLAAFMGIAMMPMLFL